MERSFKRLFCILYELLAKRENVNNRQGIWGEKGPEAFSQNTTVPPRGRRLGEAFGTRSHLTWKRNFTFSKLCFCSFPSSS